MSSGLHFPERNQQLVIVQPSSHQQKPKQEGNTETFDSDYTLFNELREILTASGENINNFLNESFTNPKIKSIDFNPLIKNGFEIRIKDENDNRIYLYHKPIITCQNFVRAHQTTLKISELESFQWGKPSIQSSQALTSSKTAGAGAGVNFSSTTISSQLESHQVTFNQQQKPIQEETKETVPKAPFEIEKISKLLFHPIIGTSFLENLLGLSFINPSMKEVVWKKGKVAVSCTSDERPGKTRTFYVSIERCCLFLKTHLGSEAFQQKSVESKTSSTPLPQTQTCEAGTGAAIPPKGVSSQPVTKQPISADEHYYKNCPSLQMKPDANADDISDVEFIRNQIGLVSVALCGQDCMNWQEEFGHFYASIPLSWEIFSQRISRLAKLKYQLNEGHNKVFHITIKITDLLEWQAPIGW